MSKIQEALQKMGKEKQVVAPDSQKAQPNGKESLLISSTAERVPVTVKDRIDPHLIVYLEPEGIIADQFRTLRTLLRFSERAKTFQKIVISSPSQKEGKTTVCLNLAIALSTEQDTSVLVIDTDFRNPSVHKMLGLKFAPGLYNFLAETVTLEQTIHETAISNLHVIPTGKQLANPTDMLVSNKMKEFLNRVISQYDYILFDAPPIIPFPDTTTIAMQSDGIILVVESEKTRIPALSSTLVLLEKANINVIGLVLNKLRGVSSEYRYRYGKY
jgi:protein-tyrosine kinase